MLAVVGKRRTSTFTWLLPTSYRNTSNMSALPGEDISVSRGGVGGGRSTCVLPAVIGKRTTNMFILLPTSYRNSSNMSALPEENISVSRGVGEGEGWG